MRVSPSAAADVLMFGWELPPYNSGGLGTASLGLTQGLAEAGVSVRFVLPELFGGVSFAHMEVVSVSGYVEPAKIEEILKLDAAERAYVASALAYGAVVRVDERRRVTVDHSGGPSGRSQLSPGARTEWYAAGAGAIAEETAAKIIHSHDWMTYAGGDRAKRVAAAQGRHIPHVAHVHSVESDRSGRRGDPRIQELERRGLEAADRVVAVSQYTKEVVRKEYGVPAEKISVVYNGVPDREPARYDFGRLKRRHKIVLFMGRITYQKGPEHFIRLAKAVTDADPSVKFVMAGSGDMEARCVQLAAKLGLTGKILFSSFLRGEDVDRAYQLADLFVMPSVSEPFGIVALEAMQNGTPSLVSRQSGAKEVSGHLIVEDFWDTAAMRDQVLRVLGDGAEAARLRAGGRADLRALSWRDAAGQLQEVYARALAGA